jgi:hypothetical protein
MTAQSHLDRIVSRLVWTVVNVCPIPPKPQTQALILSSRFHKFLKRLLLPSLFLCTIFTVLLVPHITGADPLDHLDWSWWSSLNPGNLTYVTDDFILFNRPFLNISDFPVEQRWQIVSDLGGEEEKHQWYLDTFYLREHDTVVWRDCTIYTAGPKPDDPSDELTRMRYPFRKIETGLYNPETGAIEYGNVTNYGTELAFTIVLVDSANLTLVNVQFRGCVEIRLYDASSLTMINVTNWGYGYAYNPNPDPLWFTGPYGPGEYRFDMGTVEVTDHAVVWIQDSTLGKLGGISYGGSDHFELGFCDAMTVINSSIREVRVGSRSTPQFVDCRIYELYAEPQSVALLGATAVQHQLPPSQRRGYDIAYRVTATLTQDTYRQSDSVEVTIHVTNLGLDSLVLDFADRDPIYLALLWYNETSGYADLILKRYDTNYLTDPSTLVIHSQDTGQVTVTWIDPTIPPDHYELRYWFESEILSDGSRFTPDFRIIASIEESM